MERRRVNSDVGHGSGCANVGKCVQVGETSLIVVLNLMMYRYVTS